MKPKENNKDPEKDLCMTPEYAVKPLVELLNLQEYSVWEPAAGEGDLTRALNGFGVNVEASTLEEGEDFFEESSYCLHYDVRCSDAIVTNPPYSIKREWIERCYELTNNWALLLPIEVLGGALYQELFQKHGGISILTMDSRVDFKMPTPGKSGTANQWGRSSAQFPTAWFIHGFGLESDKIYRSSISEEKSLFKKMNRMLGT